MSHSPTEIVAAVLFALAVIHTFSAKQFERLAFRYPRHGGLFHLLGEVEIVFGFWATVLIIVMAGFEGGDAALRYAESREYSEPMLVFVIMVIAASRPIVDSVARAVQALARWIPVHDVLARTWLGLGIVPLLGSLVTEPAAMTIAALTLAPLVFRKDVPEWPKYVAIGALFVNVSIGGTLTAYAAPPVLMVASTWQWDSAHMFAQFGWRAALAVIVNATVVTFALRSVLCRPGLAQQADPGPAVPMVLRLVHLLLLAGVVLLAHHPVGFLAVFMLFLGIAKAYERYQSALRVGEALMVAFFLAGLVVLGGLQRWWLQPIVAGLEPLGLFFGALGLTAIADNAALTYLGSLISGISDEAKYMLVAGAVTGGGMTVIANAPNPAGAALLRQGFADESIGAGGLLLGALGPTLVAVGFMLW